MKKAADMGFTFYVHPEIEFYLLRSPELDPRTGEPVPRALFWSVGALSLLAAGLAVIW